MMLRLVHKLVFVFRQQRFYRATTMTKNVTIQPLASRASKNRLLTGLIGAPINHSASPKMHEMAAEALGIHCFYQLMEIVGANTDVLRRLMDGLRLAGFAGFNVTFPYKQTIVPLLDACALEAAAIGAVNTVVIQEGLLIGHNTDATGFARVAAKSVEGSGRKPVALIGAGGFGRAAAFALAGLGVQELRIFDYNKAQAEALAQALPGTCQAIPAATLKEALQGVSGLVNGTPVGMWPSTESPVPTSLLHQGLWVADAVYSPLWTPLLLAAKACGATVITGRELAIWQAVDAFQLFSGRNPSPHTMEFAFDHVMAQRALSKGVHDQRKTG